jgi:hypothetical protein
VRDEVDEPPSLDYTRFECTSQLSGAQDVCVPIVHDTVVRRY